MHILAMKSLTCTEWSLLNSIMKKMWREDARTLDHHVPHILVALPQQDATYVGGGGPRSLCQAAGSRFELRQGCPQSCIHQTVPEPFPWVICARNEYTSPVYIVSMQA